MKWKILGIMFKPLKKIYFAFYNIFLKGVEIEKLKNKIDIIDERHNIEKERLKSEYEMEIHRRDSKIQDLENKLHKLGTIESLLQKLDLKLSDISSKRIREALENLRELPSNIKADLLAAKWVEMKKNEWAEKALIISIKNHSNILSTKAKQDAFFQDICNYLDWVRFSLDYGDFKILDFKRSIEYPFPYQSAFKYIRDTSDFEGLPSNSIDDLKQCFDYLIDNFT